MKQIHFILLILALSTGVATAQNFEGGITGGINVSQIDGDYLAGYNKLGYIGGAFVAYDITDRFTAQLELRYNQKGKVKGANPIEGETDYFKVVLHYAQLPMVVQYKLVNKFYVEVGIGVGYLISSKFYDGYGEYPQDLLGYEFNDFELSSLIGFSYYFTDNIYGTARWSMSFLPVANVLNNVGTAPGASPWEQAGAQFNRTIEFTVGYKFGSKLKPVF